MIIGTCGGIAFTGIGDAIVGTIQRIVVEADHQLLDASRTVIPIPDAVVELDANLVTFIDGDVGSVTIQPNVRDIPTTFTLLAFFNPNPCLILAYNLSPLYGFDAIGMCSCG